MTTSTAPANNSLTRSRTNNSGSGTVAPLNTPTRRFYGSKDQIDVDEPGVPDPNIYVVQPFKQSSVPKDFVYAKKNAPKPGEELLKSTMNLIHHFTSCYEEVKHQLQDEHTKARESVLVSRTMNVNDSVSRSTIHRPAKQARLQPLRIFHQSNKSNCPTIDDCVGILPLPQQKGNDLALIYDEKLRLLRKLKPEYFDSDGNLLSTSAPRPHSHSQVSVHSSKKSTGSSFRTPYNTVLSADNAHFDDRRTFLTEMTTEEEEDDDDETKQNEQKGTSILSNQQQQNAVSEYMNKNYVIKVLEIKTITTASTKRDRMKSGSDQTNNTFKKDNYSNKSN